MLLTILALAFAPVTSTPVAQPAPPPTPTVVQDEDAKPDKRPEIKALLGELAGHVKKKGKEDDQAIAILDRLVQEFPESGPKDRKAIVDGIDKCLKAKRKIELQPGVPDDRLHMASAVALGRMGPESVKGLIGWIGHKTHKANLRLQRELILALGKTEDPKGVDPLTELLKHPEPAMQAAGAESLANYKEIDQKVRKEIVNELIKILMGQKARIDSAPTDQEARERWDIISGPITSTLSTLTDGENRAPEAWQRWWNKNKKEDWDAER